MRFSPRHDANNEDQESPIVRCPPPIDGSVRDNRETLIAAAVASSALTREEENFVSRGVHVNVFEHPANDAAVRAAIAAGVDVALASRGLSFQARKDAVEIAAGDAARPLIRERSRLV